MEKRVEKNKKEIFIRHHFHDLIKIAVNMTAISLLFGQPSQGTIGVKRKPEEGDLNPKKTKISFCQKVFRPPLESSSSQSQFPLRVRRPIQSLTQGLPQLHHWMNQVRGNSLLKYEVTSSERKKYPLHDYIGRGRNAIVYETTNNHVIKLSRSRQEIMKRDGTSFPSVQNRGRQDVVFREQVRNFQIQLTKDAAVSCQAVLTEREIYRTLQRYNIPHMPQLFDCVMAGPFQAGLVFQNCGKRLSAYICEKNGLPLDEIKIIGRQLFETLKRLAEINYVHADLKPENLCLRDDVDLFVVDWDAAHNFVFRKSTGCQTRWYRSPEIELDLPYTSKIDVWSAGIILVEMYLRRILFKIDEKDLIPMLREMIGPPPTTASFYSKVMQSQASIVLKTEIAQLLEKEKHPDCPELIRGFILKKAESKKDNLKDANGLAEIALAILNWLPEKRPSAAQVLAHPFFKIT